jgi:hypothetical protein
MHETDGDPPVFEKPPVGTCQSYRPGHATHWIMASRYRSHPAVPAVIRDLNDTAVTVEFGGRTVVWQHHEPARLLAATLQSTSVNVIEPCTAILVGVANRHWFYCSQEPLTPCHLPER